MSPQTSTLAIFLALVVASSQGLPTTTEISKDAFESCLTANGQYYTGLKPVHSSTPVMPPNPCELFWHCRAKPKESSGERVEALQFNCSDANPAKPYYDASKCRCVATPDHCARNDDVDNQYKCLRSYNELEPVQSCRGFGRNGSYYLDLFANHDDLRKYWSCTPRISEEPVAVAMHCNEDLIFDAEFCYCNYSNATSFDKIRKFNNHPMNRFKCANPVVRQAIQHTRDNNGNG